MTSGTHEGLWRSPEPTEEQQPVPGPSRLLHDKELPSQRERAAYPTSPPWTRQPFLRGSNRTFPHSLASGPDQPTTTTTRSPLGGSRRTSPRTYESGTNPFPPSGYQMPRNFQGLFNQNHEGHYPSSPLTMPPSESQNQEKTPSPSASGQMTPTNQTRPMTPIPPLTPTTSEGTVTPSMQREGITSGPHSLTGTENSSAPTEPLPGNSGSRILMPEQAGPTPITHRSIWTTTSPPNEVTNPWVDKIVRGVSRTRGPQGSLAEYTRTRTDPDTRHQLATEFERVFDLKPERNNDGWSPTSTHSSSLRSSSLGSFESFQLNEDTFRAAIRDVGDDPWFYWRAPYPLPDEPPRNNPQRPGYRGVATSRLIAGAGPGMEGLEEINEGWAGPQPAQPTVEERMNQLM